MTFHSHHVALEKLSLVNFRCYQDLSLNLPAGPVILTGPNGAGKTNLLEAVSLLAPGKGLRNAAGKDFVRYQSSEDWAVSSVIQTPLGGVRIGTGSDRQKSISSAMEFRRQIKIDGTRKSQASLAEYLALVWLTPQMDRLFIEASSGRRRFMDRMIYGYNPHHATLLQQYEKVMRERSKILRQSLEENKPFDTVWVEALEKQMSNLAVALADNRRRVIGLLQDISNHFESPFPKPIVAVDGEVEQKLETHSALDVEDWLKHELCQARIKDGHLGGASVGAHKADLYVEHPRHNMPAHLCSTGEQKALLIGIILAQSALIKKERGLAPILLLDEIAAHLDHVRREALFELILALSGQVWMTGTEVAPFENLQGQGLFMNVENGRIHF